MIHFTLIEYTSDHRRIIISVRVFSKMIHLPSKNAHFILEAEYD